MTKKNYSEIRVGRLYQQIVEQIESRILNGELMPGDRLPSERELGKQFGVSRTSIREAIRVLTLKGLVEVSHGRGTYVIDQTSIAVRDSLNLMVQVGKKESFQNLIEVREILEPAIASIAASRATEENIKSMREVITAMDKSLHDVEKYIEADLDFHLALAEANQNPLVLILLDLLIVQLRKQRFWASSVEGSLNRSQTYHKHVLAAVEEKNPEAARNAMRDHMRQIREDIQTALNLGKLSAVDLNK